MAGGAAHAGPRLRRPERAAARRAELRGAAGAARPARSCAARSPAACAATRRPRTAPPEQRSPPPCGPRARATRSAAAARGRLRAALFAAATRSPWPRSAPGTPAAPAAWLLLREFRKATRFTRPGVDATLAVRELARRQGRSRRDAARGEEGPARRIPGEPRRSARRGRRRRRARLRRALGANRGARRRPLGDPRARVRGDARRRRTGAGRRRLRAPGEAAQRNDARRRSRPRRAQVKRALDGFTAAPFTDGGAGAAGGPADPLRRARAGRLRPRHGRRQGHDPVRDPGVDRLRGGRRVRVLGPRGGPQAARPARDRARRGTRSSGCAATSRTPATASAWWRRTRSSRPSSAPPT